jgi:uncharacterized protein YlaI
MAKKIRHGFPFSPAGTTRGFGFIECPSCHKEWLKLEDRKLTGKRLKLTGKGGIHLQGVYMITKGVPASIKKEIKRPIERYYQCPKCKARWMHSVLSNDFQRWT